MSRNLIHDPQSIISIGDPQEALCMRRWNEPTIDLAKGEVRICCRVPSYSVTKEDLSLHGQEALLNNKYLLERRQEMFKGVRHRDCAPCWKAEASGQPTPRIGAEEIMKKTGTYIQGIPLGHKALRTDKVSFLEIQMGNLCDLKCIYCWRFNSSKWAQEDLLFGKISQKEYEDLNRQAPDGFEEQYWKWFESIAPTLEMLSFVGGEPTMHASFRDLVLRAHRILQKQENKTCRFRLVTNLNSQERSFAKFLDVLGMVENEGRTFLIDISMEAFAARAEWIRFGLVWERFERNLVNLLARRFRNIAIGFSATVNALSITSFEDLFRHLAPLRREFGVAFPFLENTVLYPSWLAPTILTPDFREYLKDTICAIREFEDDYSFHRPDPVWGFNWFRYSEYLKKIMDGICHESNCSDEATRWTRARFHRGIRELEKRRNISFVSTFPEMKNFAELCEKLN